jgi:DNA replication protein DnaC
MPGARRLYRLASGYEGTLPIGFCDDDEREHFAQTTDASGNRSSQTRNRVHYVTALPGSGKTHLLQAVGQELIRKGRRILFTSCEMLVQELLIAKRDLKLSKQIKKYAQFEGMIIDDLGYIRQTREEMEVVFTLLAERYERGSVLLTSNLPFSKWEGIFKDPMTTAAAIDRLVHHSIIIELNIPSYRLEHAKTNIQTPNTDGEEPPTIVTDSAELPSGSGLRTSPPANPAETES